MTRLSHGQEDRRTGSPVLATLRWAAKTEPATVEASTSAASQSDSLSDSKSIPRTLSFQAEVDRLGLRPKASETHSRENRKRRLVSAIEVIPRELQLLDVAVKFVQISDFQEDGTMRPVSFSDYKKHCQPREVTNQDRLLFFSLKLMGVLDHDKDGKYIAGPNLSLFILKHGILDTRAA